MPTKPGLKLEHHKHPLLPKIIDSTWECDGCLEFGVGEGHHCSECDFILHEQCTERFDKKMSFNRFPECTFVLSKKIEYLIGGGKGASEIKAARCQVCGKPANGYVYRCTHCCMDIHPACATLPAYIYTPNESDRLELAEKITSTCYWCHNERLPGLKKSWCYVSNIFEVHVGCLKDLFLEHKRTGNVYGNSGNFGLPSSNNDSRALVVRKKQPGRSVATAIGRAVFAVLGSLQVVGGFFATIVTAISSS